MFALIRDFRPMDGGDRERNGKAVSEIASSKREEKLVRSSRHTHILLAGPALCFTCCACFCANPFVLHQLCQSVNPLSHTHTHTHISNSSLQLVITQNSISATFATSLLSLSFVPSLCDPLFDIRNAILMISILVMLGTFVFVYCIAHTVHLIPDSCLTRSDIANEKRLLNFSVSSGWATDQM